MPCKSCQSETSAAIWRMRFAASNPSRLGRPISSKIKSGFSFFAFLFFECFH
jgi:hypothetical protein